MQSPLALELVVRLGRVEPDDEAAIVKFGVHVVLANVDQRAGEVDVHLDDIPIVCERGIRTRAH